MKKIAPGSWQELVFALTCIAVAVWGVFAYAFVIVILVKDTCQ